MDWVFDQNGKREKKGQGEIGDKEVGRCDCCKKYPFFLSRGMRGRDGRWGDTTKRLMSSPKCRSVEVINNPARPGSNHREVNYINYK